MLWSKIKKAVMSQFRGRTRYWIIAFVVSSILLIWWLYHQRHTCNFMFHPREVVKTGALLWAWLFAFVGVTNRVKIVFGIVSFIWLNAFVITLGHPRIPSNEYSAARRLQQIPAAVKTLNKAVWTLAELDHGLNIAPDGDRRSYLSGYVYELSFPDSANASRYLISARPQTYCNSGQRSFLLEANGKIHVTWENRAATLQDPAVEP